MEQVLQRQVWRRRGLIALGGAVIWVVVFLAAYVYAGRTGLPLWPTVVTWDEWVVAVGLLPKLAAYVLAIRGPEDVANRFMKRVFGVMNTLAQSLLMTFLLDVICRALFGLGWEPF